MRIPSRCADESCRRQRKAGQSKVWRSMKYIQTHRLRSFQVVSSINLLPVADPPPCILLCRTRPTMLALSSTRLLLLILHLLDVVFRDLLMILRQPIKDIIAHISLHGNLLPARRRLRHATARRELLPKLLGDLLQLQPEQLEPGHLGDVFALVALDALDDDLARGALLGLLALGGFSFGSLLRGVLLRALLGVDAEGAEVLREGLVAVDLGVEVGVVGEEPVGALFGGAAVFTVLVRMPGQWDVGEGAGWAAVVLTYFGWEGADAAVDDGLWWADVAGRRGGLCHCACRTAGLLQRVKSRKARMEGQERWMAWVG